jgi:hypothetical protein
MKYFLGYIRLKEQRTYRLILAETKEEAETKLTAYRDEQAKDKITGFIWEDRQVIIEDTIS